VIYFIQAGKRGSIKIGYTNQPVSRRITDLQIACPAQLYLLLVIRGSEETEKRLHRKFAHLHRRGEWFYPGRRLLRYLAQRQHQGISGDLPDPDIRRRRPPLRKGRIRVWIQAFTDRPNLMLQWFDPATGKRKSRSAGTSDYSEAEGCRNDLEYELNATAKQLEAGELRRQSKTLDRNGQDM
jgi:hypothetical protein